MGQFKALREPARTSLSEREAHSA